MLVCTCLNVSSSTACKIKFFFSVMNRCVGTWEAHIFFFFFFKEEKGRIWQGSCTAPIIRYFSQELWVLVEALGNIQESKIIYSTSGFRLKDRFEIEILMTWIHVNFFKELTSFFGAKMGQKISTFFDSKRSHHHFWRKEHSSVQLQKRYHLQLQIDSFMNWFATMKEILQ